MSTMTSVKRLIKQPSFLVAFVVLLLAAVGLNAATQFLQLHFKKQPVPLAHSLDNVPPLIGTWVNVLKDQLADDVEQELGTDKYVMRVYLNTSQVDRADVAAFDDPKLDNKDRLVLLGKLRDKFKGRLDGAIISLGVTYYTGKADTVAHIPEGYEPTDAQTESWDLRSKQSPDGKLDVRYISFEDQAGTQRVKRNVSYLFHVNGHYTADANVVRIALQNLSQKYGYYSKVELMIQDNAPDGRDKARESMQNFLTYALPEVEKCLPDWSKLPK
jgi:hypothetical protein